MTYVVRISLWRPSDPEAHYRWQTELALAEEPPSAVYARYQIVV